MAEPHSKQALRDNFLDLVELMDQKKPYTPVAPPTLAPRMSYIANSMQSPSRERDHDNSTPSRATHSPALLSVVDYIKQSQEEPTVSASNPDGCGEQDTQHLASLSRRINNNETAGRLRTSDPRYREPILIPELESAILFQSTDLPTPVDILPLGISVPSREPEPVVRLSTRVQEKIGRDIDELDIKDTYMQKRILELENDVENYRKDGHETSSELGKLKYQTKVSRTQTSDLIRTLNEKELKIKYQQVEIDRLKEELVTIETELKKFGSTTGDCRRFFNSLASLHDEHGKAIQQLNASKHEEHRQAQTNYEKLEMCLKQMKIERDEALAACNNAGNGQIQAQEQHEKLVKRERVIDDLTTRHREEHQRATQLEDELEKLKARTDTTVIEELKEKLREKTSQSDRLRSQLKLTEQHLKNSQDRIMKAANNGASLLGAAHLVTPQALGKLPRNVVSCSECYANNLNCDDSTCCRSCCERNTQCARWRCSLKHKLGECPLAPCKLPHDPQGWLVLSGSRPQW